FDFTLVEEIGRARLSAVGAGPAHVAFDAEHPFPGLVIVADFAAAKHTGKARASSAAAINEIPVRVSPVGAKIGTDVETVPIVRCLWRASPVNPRPSGHGRLPPRPLGGPPSPNPPTPPPPPPIASPPPLLPAPPP